MARRYRETDSAMVREDLARFRSMQPCPDCGGTRLRREARSVFLVGESGPEPRRMAIFEISRATLRESLEYFQGLHLRGAKAEIADKVVREIGLRLKFLNDVGLNYLSLDRSAETLSGGEAQRIRLASQIGSGLTGVMYVLDEPSIGLHQRDNDRLIGTLRHLRDIGNSVIVVEHDEDMIHAADHVIDMGPGAGVHGGRVMAQGTYDEVAAHPGFAHRPVPVGHEEDRGAQAPHAVAAGGCQAGLQRGQKGLALSAKPGRRAARRARGGASRVADRSAGDSRDRRHRQQPEERERGFPGRPVHLRDRRLGLGQVDAGQ